MLFIMKFLLKERKGKDKMNKLFSKIATLSVGLAMAVGVGVALGHVEAQKAEAASPVTFTLSSAESVTLDNITVSFGQGVGSNAPSWYAAGLRLYASNTVNLRAGDYLCLCGW